jgi:hypothetical protein
VKTICPRKSFVGARPFKRYSSVSFKGVRKMLWPQHIFCTQLVFGAATWSDAFWSVAPDLPMILLVPWPIPWSLIQDWWVYSVLYKVPHSLLFLILIQNSRARKIYALHILLDILSHTGPWSIEPFWPLGGPVSGIGDAIVWV